MLSPVLVLSYYTPTFATHGVLPQHYNTQLVCFPSYKKLQHPVRHMPARYHWTRRLQPRCVCANSRNRKSPIVILEISPGTQIGPGEVHGPWSQSVFLYVGLQQSKSVKICYIVTDQPYLNGQVIVSDGPSVSTERHLRFIILKVSLLYFLNHCVCLAYIGCMQHIASPDK